MLGGRKKPVEEAHFHLKHISQPTATNNFLALMHHHFGVTKRNLTQY